MTGITFSSSYAEVEIGKTLQLTATISPSNATVKALQWTSSNTSVASVSNTGLVTAKALGATVITATATDGSGVSATCTVAVGAKTETHEYVDLGLSVKWATCNVGAENPEKSGDYFAWGETIGYNSGKTNFSWSTYKWNDGSYNPLTKYCTSSSYGTVDNKTVLEAADDAAIVNWNSGWRMPTQAEWLELTDNCTWKWTQLNGAKGYLVTSNKTGYTSKSIFLPAAGCRDDADLYNAGSYGYYWSGSLYTDYCGNAWYVGFGLDDHFMNYGGRYYGLSVRAVRTK